jgi:hypothetical protein
VHKNEVFINVVRILKYCAKQNILKWHLAECVTTVLILCANFPVSSGKNLSQLCTIEPSHFLVQHPCNSLFISTVSLLNTALGQCKEMCLHIGTAVSPLNYRMFHLKCIADYYIWSHKQWNQWVVLNSCSCTTLFQQMRSLKLVWRQF